MAKDTAPPKAVNIVRPSHSFMPQKSASRVSTSSSSAASFVSAPPTTYLYQQQQQQQQQHSHTQQNNQYQRHPITTTKAPRVASTTKVHDTVNHPNKPAFNIYHPPSPPQPQQRSKTFSLIDSSHSNSHRRSIITSSSSSSLSNTHHNLHQLHGHHSTTILSPPSSPPQQYTSSSTASSFSSISSSSSSSASQQQQQQQHRPHFEIYKPPSRAKTLSVPPAGLVSQQHSPRRPTSHHSTIRNVVVSPISKPHEEPITTTHSIVHHNNTIHDESPDELSDQDDDDDNDDHGESEDDKNQQAEDGLDEEEEEEVNEARVNRKIADLEISNQSLLAVNSMLEATVRKQASEVARMKSQISGQHPIEPIPPPMILAENTDLSDDEWEKDEQFCRLFRMTEQMIEQGKKALSFEFKAMGRVLSQYNQEDDEEQEEEGDDDKIENKETKNKAS